MRAIYLSVAIAAVSAAMGAGASAQERAPAALDALKPHEVVEQVLGLRQELALTEEQVTQLNGLHVAIRDEKHQYSHAGGKPHTTTHQVMVTSSQAYADAMAILTPDQRPRAAELLTTLPETVKVPAALQGLKPHVIVERVLAERERLALSDDQARQLDELHVMIRDEKHRYTHEGGKPHQTTHQQMVTRSQAFADAMAILTPDQRLKAIEGLSGSEK
jgi:hypothetical protein